MIGFGLFSVPQDIALAASILFGLISLAEGLIGGVFWIFQPAHSRRPAADPQASSEPSLVERPIRRA